MQQKVVHEHLIQLSSISGPLIASENVWQFREILDFSIVSYLFCEFFPIFYYYFKFPFICCKMMYFSCCKSFFSECYFKQQDFHRIFQINKFILFKNVSCPILYDILHKYCIRIPNFPYFFFCIENFDISMLKNSDDRSRYCA